MRRVMVATDSSKGADRAVDVAAEFAKALAGDLLIATVADSLSVDKARKLAGADGSIGDVLEALMNQTLKAAEAPARHQGIAKIELRTGSGDVAQSLINIVASTSVEMLVLGRPRQRLPEARRSCSLYRCRRSMRLQTSHRLKTQNML